MEYLVPGSAPTNDANYFKDVDFYQYVLPSGVSPVSGLTPVIGLPNNYTGTNNVTVQVSNPFNNATLQVKGISSDCNNVQSSNFNNINIFRPQLSLSGVSSIRCGETDTKTFTVQNVPSGTNCITSYTWQIANKGWKYNGTIPTSDVVTTTPSIQLQSADNNAAPPQSFSVVVAAGASSVTLNKTISYLAPSISLPTYAGEFGLDCNVTNANAILTNAPVNSYNLLWSTANGFTINNAASPQSSGTTTTVSVEKAGTESTDLLTVSLQASCGTINSVGGFIFEGCYPWDDLTVNYMYTVPMSGEPIIAYCSTEDKLDWGFVEFEWFWFDGNTYTFAGNSPSLSFWSNTWPCGMNSLYVRAKGYNGTTLLKYVGDYDGYCGRFLTTPTRKEEVRLFPNPTTNFIILDYAPKNNSAIIRVVDMQGKLLIQQVIKNDDKKTTLFTKLDISKLPKGKYIVEIQDGKNKHTKLIVKQ